MELLEGTTSESPISKFIDKKGEGIHHLAFEVKDIQSEIDRLTKLGYQLINSEPKDGADNKRIVFLHPKSTNGVLVELCQRKLNFSITFSSEVSSEPNEYLVVLLHYMLNGVIDEQGLISIKIIFIEHITE